MMMHGWQTPTPQANARPRRATPPHRAKPPHQPQDPLESLSHPPERRRLEPPPDCSPHQTQLRHHLPGHQTLASARPRRACRRARHQPTREDHPRDQGFLTEKLQQERIWTSSQLIEEVKEHFGVKVGWEAMRLRLLRLGYCWKRTRYVPCKEIDAQVEHEHKANLETLKRGLSRIGRACITSMRSASVWPCR